MFAIIFNFIKRSLIDLYNISYNKLFKSSNKFIDNKSKDFIWSNEEEPHKKRRQQILKLHPEVKNLMKHEPITKYIIFLLVLFQINMGIYMKDIPFWSIKYWTITYIFGATVTQSIFLGIHEISHMLAFKNFTYNKLLTIFANLPIAIPYSISFRDYHLEHHKYQGHDKIDTDIPTLTEGLLFTNVLFKTLFCINQILFYAIRPMIVRKQNYNRWHILNWAIILGFDTIIIYNYGFGPIYYWLLSDYLAGSLHPCAAHFIAEHYVFVDGVETYSYYGPLNILCFNVGYHNEHHDFPNIPWTKLPMLKKIAPEFYDNIPQHKSWPLVIWKFITNEKITCLNRIKRKNSKDE